MKTGKTPRVLSNILNTPLLRNLLITSLIVSVIFPIYSVFVIIPSFSNQLARNTEDEAVRTASYLEHLILKNQTELTRGSLSNDSISEIETVKKAFRLEKLKIFSKQGEIIFSTTSTEIGEINKNDYFFDIVAKGNIYTKVVRKDAKSLEGNTVTADVVETYVPVLFNEAFIGAFEIYYDITSRKKDLDSLLTLIYLVLFAIASILMVTVLFILFKASRNILDREQAELALREAYEGLESQVNERTIDLKKSNAELMNEIAERKQAQESLQESEERFRKISDSAQDAIVMMNNKGEITYWNKAAEHIFQYKSDEILHKDLQTLLAPQRYAEPFKKSFEKFILTGNGQAIGKIGNLWAKRKDGEEFPMDLSLSSVKIKGAWNAIGIIRDISEREKAEKEKRELAFQLAQAQKMESIGTLAGGIAHDFNNILTSIIGYTDLALIDVETGSTLEGNIKEVKIAGNRAKELVKQILAFSRQGKNELKPIRPRMIVEESLKLLRSSIPTTITIKQNIESDSLIMSDPTQIHQIVMNLCVNAAHAMEDSGGTLAVELTDVLLDDADARKHVDLSQGDYLKLVVADTGSGIRPEIIEFIFDPYFTTKKPGVGTGLGLSVVHGIVKQIGGEITVESELGKGSTFTIYLPVLRKSVKIESETLEGLPGGNENILVIDDETPIVNMCKQMLISFGYKVTFRTSSIESLELFKKRPNEFDLILTDMTMPSMTGDRLAVELMKIRPDIPVILCTGYSRILSERKAAEIGIKAFIMKPYGRDELAKTVRKVLDEAKAD
ncbi:MAG: ATP-binding protein [Thermodesulfobacteriota bacterium]